MQNIAELLHNQLIDNIELRSKQIFHVKEAKSFRAYLISQFIERIKSERVGTQWEVKDDKKFSKHIALKINMNPFLRETWQLQSFLKQCQAAKHFSACFYGATKTK